MKTALVCLAGISNISFFGWAVFWGVSNEHEWMVVLIVPALLINKFLWAVVEALDPNVKLINGRLYARRKML